MKDIRLTLGVLASFALLSSPAALAHGHGDMDNDDDDAPAITVRGELIDVACYVAEGERGAKHAACARACAENGLPVGLLDAKGHVYLLIDKAHKPVNHDLAPRMGETVIARGSVSHRGGVDLLEVESVSPPAGAKKP